MPKLTEKEQQEVIRLIEANQSLPDKYRFLLFEDKREVELVWNGKTNEVCNVVLPFQTIEQVDEPRLEKEPTSLQLFDLDDRGRQLKGWTNKLVWGDNKLILSSLKNGPLRDEIEKQGGIKLIYIDPPFDVGADFSMDIEIGEETFVKEPNILEEIAYRDTWGNGADSYIAMMYERLQLMRDLLADDGSIYVHCDYRVQGYIRLIMDEVFGKDCILNELVWCYGEREITTDRFNKKHDNIYFYAKNSNNKNRPFNCWDIAQEYSLESIKKYNQDDGDGRRYQIRGCGGPYTGKQQLDKSVEMEHPEWTYRDYLDEKRGVLPRDWFSDITFENRASNDRTGYPTQKPTKLIERLVLAASNEGNLVADFFCGSGTTAAVAERLGRKWIVADIGKFAIHTTRKRLIGVQRELKEEGKDYRAFEVLNLGKYERQHYIGLNANTHEAEQEKLIRKREKEFLELILRAYQAESVAEYRVFQGKKNGRLIAVGPINLPVTRLFIEATIAECLEKHITRVDVLGFEFEMGMFPTILNEAKAKGIDILPKYIPKDVFDKRAVDKGQVNFHDVAYIEIKPIVRGNSLAIELTDYSVHYSQDSIENAEQNVRNRSSRVVVEQGQIIGITKDKDGCIQRKRLTKSWTDWIDYWAVDFNFENKREIIRIKSPEKGEIIEKWTGDYVFENEWQSFRTKKDRNLELTSAFNECEPGERKIAVKVVDIFGNDTMNVIKVSIGGKK